MAEPVRTLYLVVNVQSEGCFRLASARSRGLCQGKFPKRPETLAKATVGQSRVANAQMLGSQCREMEISH